MSGYVDGRGIYYPPGQPNLAYDPGHAVRFLRSQFSWNGTPEIEDQYKGSQEWAGWAAARATPNRVPFIADSRWSTAAPARYNLPSGPTSPKDLLQQRTVPPTFPAGSWQIYADGRYYQTPHAHIGTPGGGSGGGLGVAEMSDAVAIGLKKILPELATSLGVQTARANAQQVHSRPANIDIPVRAFEFTDCNQAPVNVSDGTFVLVTEHVVPVGCMAVAQLLEVNAESGAALMDTEVQIRVGGLPVPRYNSLNCPDFGQPGQPAKINIKAIERQRVQVFARARTVGATHNVSAMIRGYDFPPSFMTNLDSISGWRGQ